jgi:hypothetical protein
MKKLVSTLLLYLVTVVVFAQSGSNLVVFSEDGYKFYLILNGIRQNDLAQTNVRVTGLNQPYYSAIIIFEDKTQPSIDKKNLYVVDVADNANLEVTYKIKKNSKAQNVLRYFSGVPIAQAMPSNPQVGECNYNTTPMPQIGTTVITQQITTTTNGNNTNVSTGTSGIGVGINMNVNVNEPVYNETTTPSYNSTTSSNTYNNTSMDNSNYNNNQQQNNSNCNYAMLPTNFSAAKSTISKQSFDETKLSTAKQVISSNCLTAAQIKEIMLLFSFEETRLTLAKEAHLRCIDKNNYFVLNDAFNFSSSVEELNNSLK